MLLTLIWINIEEVEVLHLPLLTSTFTYHNKVLADTFCNLN
jgi:hypothetical protein